MREYHHLLHKIMASKNRKGDRTGTGTYSIFGHQMRFDLSKGFPLVTTKKVFTKGIIHELLWFLKGETNVEYLQDNGVSIWNEWANKDGKLGPIYGKQWRSWEVYQDSKLKTIDQISEVIDTIKKDPNSRRMIVSAWNVSDLSKMALHPCHCLFQFYVSKGKLSCQLYQRSADCFLGVPFNIASYALLTMMMAQVTNLKPGDFIHTFGDAHIYTNHLDQVRKQLKRNFKPLPKLELNPAIKDIFEFKYEDIKITGYDPHPAIKGKVSV